MKPVLFFEGGRYTTPVSDELEQRIAYVEQLVAANGPAPSEYAAFNAWLAEVAADLQDGRLATEHLAALQRAFGEALSPETIQGFSFSKPHGYAGDYEIIDRIYRKHVSDDPRLRNWDLFCHAQSGPKAVRNRKGYLIELLQGLAAKTDPTDEAFVLNVASGPCRDLQEFFAATDERSRLLTFDCIDSDPDAIAYATRLCCSYLDRIRFFRANALRFTTPQRYRLIWSAGLFDYLEDKAFGFLLGRLLSMLRHDGELVVGNFSLENPTRPYMEVVGDWHLNHRSPEDLIRLAMQCGVAREDIRVGVEPEGVNLFLHIKRGAAFI